MSEPYWVPLGTSPQAVQGTPGIVNLFREGHTFGVMADLTAVVNVPSFFVPKSATQLTQLIAVRHKIRAGTSIGVQLRLNGASVGGVITVTQTATTLVLTPVTLADMDELSIVLSAPVGTPTDLTFTLVLETTAS